MLMKISVLCDDSAYTKEFYREHGFSALIEIGGRKILFDAGQSDVFLKNAELLGEDLRDVDIVVLSHGHYDHCNGLGYFLERNHSAKIYLHKTAMGEFYHGERYIGIAPAIKAQAHRFCYVEKETELDVGVTLFPAAELPLPGPSSLGMITDGEEAPDVFDHEIYLVLRQEGCGALFTGCGHRGITEIADWAFQNGLSHVVGGYHLTESLSENVLTETAEKLLALPMHYYSCHCTCDKAADVLRTVLGKRFSSLSAGMQFVIGRKSEVAAFLFRKGYNCSQSVFGAFAEELELPFETAMKLACSFGGGMGRLREVCGAVSGMLLVCGLAQGYHTPETGAVKAEHYRLVQSLAKRFREQHGSLCCRELLGGTVSDLPTPTERTPEFYKLRPCERLIASAADILEEMLFKTIKQTDGR